MISKKCRNFFSLNLTPITFQNLHCCFPPPPSKKQRSGHREIHDLALQLLPLPLARLETAAGQPAEAARRLFFPHRPFQRTANSSPLGEIFLFVSSRWSILKRLQRARWDLILSTCLRLQIVPIVYFSNTENVIISVLLASLRCFKGIRTSKNVMKKWKMSKC